MRLLFIITIQFIAYNSNAQNITSISVNERATKELTFFKQKFLVTVVQDSALLNTFTNYYTAMQALRQVNDPDERAVHIKKITAEKETAILKILTSDQLVLYRRFMDSVSQQNSIRYKH